MNPLQDQLFSFLKFFKCLFIFERERERASREEAERERETQNPNQAPRSELSAHILMQSSNP